MAPPIIFFTHQRYDTTSRVLEAIRHQTHSPSCLIVFSDGPRSEAEIEKVEKIRQLIRSIDWIEVKLIERKTNLGCSRNIIDGLSQVFNDFEKAVILEDDTLPTQKFYYSCVLMLDYYQGEKDIFSVGGFPHILKGALPKYEYDSIVSPRFGVWGWGTWADRWEKVIGLLKNYKNPFGEINNIPTIAGSDLLRMAQRMDENKGGNLYSWAVPIALYCLYHKYYQVATRDYMIKNIGIGTSGSHGKGSEKTVKFFDEYNVVNEMFPEKFPPVDFNEDVALAIQDYVSAWTASKKITWIDKINRKFKELIGQSNELDA